MKFKFVVKEKSSYFAAFENNDFSCVVWACATETLPALICVECQSCLFLHGIFKISSYLTVYEPFFFQLWSVGGTSSGHCWLVEGTRQKNYRPLLERPCCESLESRINHFVKRGRLLLEGDENGEETVQRAKRSKHVQNSPPDKDVSADQPAGGPDEKPENQ